MSLVSHRNADYRVSVVDTSGRVKRVLTTVTGGRITLNSHSKLKSSGEITVVGDDGKLSLGDRVRIDYVHDGGEWSLGTFWASTPTMRVSESHVEYRVELLGMLAFLDEDCLERAFTVPAGANVVDTVVGVIKTVGGFPVAAVPSPATTVSALVFQPGTSKLRIVNDLLESINYWSVFTDSRGAFVLAPYLRPVKRGVAWRFHEGEESVHSAVWEREQDTARVPNKVVVVSNPPADKKPAFIGVATNEDASSVFSFQSRGRWITHIERGVEATSQTGVNELARRKLIGLSTPQATLTIEHAPVPIDVAQAVEFRSQGYSRLCVIREIEYELNPGALVKSRLAEVVDL